MKITAGQPNELGGAQPGLDGQLQERMVAPPGPRGTFWAGQQRSNLRASEEADERTIVSLRGNREHALDEFGAPQRVNIPGRWTAIIRPPMCPLRYSPSWASSKLVGASSRRPEPAS